jgi:hypothetical protein
LLAVGVRWLDGPSHRVALYHVDDDGARVGGEQGQVVGLVGVNLTDQHAPPGGVGEAAVPDTQATSATYAVWLLP